MFGEHRPLWVEINLDNLALNIRNIKSLLKPGTDYISVVKADAYGHGAVEVAKTCMACGVNRLAVALLDEALELRSLVRCRMQAWKDCQDTYCRRYGYGKNRISAIYG